MRLGLTGRILIGGVLLGAFMLTQVVVTYDAFRTVRQATREEQAASRSIAVALRVEKLALDLQTGARGYAITGQRRFLAPWQEARRALPARLEELETYGPPSFGRALDREVDPIVGWSGSLVRLASASPAKARARIATGVGLQRMSRVQSLLDGFVVRRQALLAHDEARVTHAENTGLRIGALGIAVRLLVFFAFIAYLLRAIVVPLRRLSAGTRQVAAGAMVEVPQGGAGEVGELERSFNEMSRSLAQSRRELDEQNVRLERGATVLRAVLDSTVDGILLSDPDGNVRLANRPMQQLEQELGPLVDRLHAAMGEGADVAELEDAETGRVLEGFTSPVLDDAETPIGRLWIVRDVSRQRELDRLKDEFVATVSHELRTPLTSMVGFLEMLRSGEAGELSEQQQSFLAIVHRSSERLQRLVGDLLFVGRLDAAGLQLQLEPVDVDELAREAVETHTALARSRELELVADLQPVPPLPGDPQRLAQLVGNLVSNALKFTLPGGRVETRTFVAGDRAVIEVEDTGIGIPAAELPRVFDRFFRSSAALEHAIPGTGLGLVISKAIAEAHGGTVTVRSEAGRGTCFRVELPLRPAHESAAAA